MEQKQPNGKALYIFLALILAGSVGIGSFLLGRNAYPAIQSLIAETEPSTTSPEETMVVTEISPMRRLRITATVDENAKFTTIPKEELGGNFDEDIVYLDLVNVNIEIDGEAVRLEHAIRDGLISPEEIFAYARLDARNGICTESYETEHSLTTFLYRYPEFDLKIVYDVYVTPEGKSHIISNMGLYKRGSYVTTTYTDYETGLPLNYEDWGLAFEVTETTSTSITLNCTQSGGQQFGALVTEWYSIFLKEDYGYVPTLSGISSTDQYSPQITLPMNGSSQITIDWTTIYGELAPGSYYIKLHIADIYDVSQVHTLVENYSDCQGFWIEFVVP